MSDKATSITLEEMFREERHMIQHRRNWAASAYSVRGTMKNIEPDDVTLSLDGHDDDETDVRIALDDDDLDLVGLALSGGGIRSAAFGLGVLQALARAGVYRRIDYLSTVSGGGYIGAALTATSYVRRGEFAFDNVEGEGNPALPPREIQDSPTVSHLRNYSNFLVPRGAPDWVTGAALIVRGLVANCFMIAPWLLLAASLTLAYNPVLGSLARIGPAMIEGRFPQGAAVWLDQTLGAFAWPAMVAALLALFCLGWSIVRSTPRGELTSEFKGKTAQLGGGALILLLVCIGLSLQNELLAWLLAPVRTANPVRSSGFMTLVKSTLLASPLVVFLVSTFGDRLARIAGQEASRLTGMLAKQGSKLALLAGACAMPLLLWLIYLRAVYWGLRCNAVPTQCLNLLGGLTVAGWQADRAYLPALVLAGCAGVLWAITWKLAPNSYSLHRLYRDRLAQAFIVHPLRSSKSEPSSLDMVHNLRLSQLVRKVAGPGLDRFVHGPFPLMNTALNVQASTKVNRRGRNAEFFVFTPLHAGSWATGYVPIVALERMDRNLNLAAVMAISGAAANSNMGANTIRPLSTTLALLNVRLGYWLPNPKRLIEGTFRNSRSWFLLQEMLSRLDENTDRVLLTDGGHIENLGIYELLRRRCKVIIVADAEADAGMNFPSFIALQRYARIDLGIRIELPWQPIADATRAIIQAHAERLALPPGEHGPHAALGIIHYDNGEQGFLLYLKSSLTGDENDYVRDYARRNPSFPHETTADQFFSEEQFEAYRALGFHVTFDALKGTADIVLPDGAAGRINAVSGKVQAARPKSPAQQVCAMLGL